MVTGCECVEESETRRSGEVDIISMEKGPLEALEASTPPDSDMSAFPVEKRWDDQRSVAK
jgi:hypothetical protein